MLRFAALVRWMNNVQPDPAFLPEQGGISDNSGTISFEEYLDRYGSLTYYNKGVSMKPLLYQNRDLFTVKATHGERCHKYDVVLYKRHPHRYVLHRIIQVREHDYVIMGDNCIRKEYGITDHDILGVMVSYVRKGKTRTVEDWRYIGYSRIWVALTPFRIIYRRLQRIFRMHGKGKTDTNEAE